jgi:uncharacterized protein
MPFLIISILALALLLFGAWWGQERIAFQPPGIVEPLPSGAARVQYEADDGQPLHALIVMPRGAESSRAPLIAFHGNADLAAWLVPWAVEAARRTRMPVMIPEYRGYGGNPGRPSADGIRRDARAAAAFAHTHFGTNAPPALYGHSLGSAIATELAAEIQPRVLLLESPFTSARAVAATYGTPLLRWLWPLLGRIPYETERRVRELDIPLSVAHGERDRVISVQMGRAVHAAARRPAELFISATAHHTNLAEAGGEEYWRWLERALR